MSRILSRRAFLRLGGLSLGSAVLAACAPASPTANIPDPEPAGISQDTPEMAEPSPVPTSMPEPTPVQAVSVDRPFSATNPESVVLAAGHPQLVEFFAFW